MPGLLPTTAHGSVSHHAMVTPGICRPMNHRIGIGMCRVLLCIQGGFDKAHSEPRGFDGTEAEIFILALERGGMFFEKASR